jgi:hypothetical protein
MKINVLANKLFMAPPHLQLMCEHHHDSKKMQWCLSASLKY